MPAIVPPNIKETIGFIFEKKNENPIGSGFILNSNDDYYFITSKHVIRDYDKIFIRINTKTRTKYIRHNLIKNKPKYHQNPAIDIAVLKIKKQEFALNIGMIIDKAFLRKIPLCEGDDVFFIGLLPQKYGNKKNTPVVRQGAIVLVTDEPFVDEEGSVPFFYIEANCHPGNSGSPVFLRLSSMDANGNINLTNQHSLLLGVMYGYIHETKEIKHGWRKLKLTESVQVALVSPARGILDILKK